jgi:hypothetical protein
MLLQVVLALMKHVSDGTQCQDGLWGSDVSSKVGGPDFDQLRFRHRPAHVKWKGHIMPGSDLLFAKVR